MYFKCISLFSCTADPYCSLKHSNDSSSGSAPGCPGICPICPRICSTGSVEKIHLSPLQTYILNLPEEWVMFLKYQHKKSELEMKWIYCLMYSTYLDVFFSVFGRDWIVFSSLLNTPVRTAVPFRLADWTFQFNFWIKMSSSYYLFLLTTDDKDAVFWTVHGHLEGCES